MKLNPNDSAFPRPESHPGLSTRLYLAGQAIVGLLAFPGDAGSRQYIPAEVASSALAIADALIEAANR